MLKRWAEEILDIAQELFRRILNALNWRLVRGVGQLQILTRALYALLIVVPLLAGLWPAVKIVVNMNNQAVSEAIHLLRAANTDLVHSIEHAKLQFGGQAKNFSKTINEKDNERADQLLSELEIRIQRISALGDRYSAEFADRTITAVKLPWSFGAAFFAALFVVFGHLVYQLRAPEQIRAFTWDDFVSFCKEDYAKHGTSDALQRAREYLELKARTAPSGE